MTWFMAHRIREAMRAGGLVPPLGGEGEIVEADETYYGRADEKKLTKKRYSPYAKSGWKNKGAARPIVSLVERGGRVRSFHVDAATKDNVTKIVRENVARIAAAYRRKQALRNVGNEFEAHETMKHSAKEYVRGDVHSNSVEGYFGLFKRG